MIFRQHISSIEQRDQSQHIGRNFEQVANSVSGPGQEVSSLHDGVYASTSDFRATKPFYEAATQFGKRSIITKLYTSLAYCLSRCSTLFCCHYFGINYAGGTFGWSLKKQYTTKAMLTAWMDRWVSWVYTHYQSGVELQTG